MMRLHFQIKQKFVIFIIFGMPWRATYFLTCLFTNSFVDINVIYGV